MSAVRLFYVLIINLWLDNGRAYDAKIGEGDIFDNDGVYNIL